VKRLLGGEAYCLTGYGIKSILYQFLENKEITMNENNVITSEGICACRDSLIRRAKCKGVPENSASDVADSAIASVLEQDKSKYTLAYLFKTLSNKLINRFRQKKRMVNLEDDTQILDIHYKKSMLLDNVIESSENAAFFKELFQLLSSREEQIFQLYYIQGKKRAEVVKIMNITQGALGNSLRGIEKKTELARIRSQHQD
jgi:RNA polymerase sigma factor (sigma-70 family)